MKKYLPTVLLGACLVLDAEAQSFGDFLKSALTETAKNVVTNSATRALTPNADAARAPAAAEAEPGEAAPAAALPASAAPAAAQAAAAPGCKRIKGANLSAGPKPDSFEPAILWPENTCPVGSFGGFEFKQAQAAKTAFREASAYPCKDCEGGRYFDAWGGRSLIRNGGDYSKEFPKLLVALEPGKSVGWKGTKFSVTITATGEHPIGDTPCKQLHYTLKQGAKTVSEYDGMFCKWQGPYSSQATWQETV